MRRSILHDKKLTSFSNCWILTGQIILELSLKWDTTDSNCCSRHKTSRQEADYFWNCWILTGQIILELFGCWSETQSTAIVAVDTGHREAEGLLLSEIQPTAIVAVDTGHREAAGLLRENERTTLCASFSQSPSVSWHILQANWVFGKCCSVSTDCF